MARVALVTVPDEGAAWMVRDALGDAGIEAEIERARADHPYMASALAHPMRIFVAKGDLERARGVLAALESELANHEEELSAEALAAGQITTESPADPARLDERALPRLSWALALGLLLPVPGVCFYARAPRLGGVLLGAFLIGVFYFSWGDLVWYFEDQDYAHPPPALIAPASKVADLALGLPLVILRRRRAARARAR
jgi:hypothetical protein